MSTNRTLFDKATLRLSAWYVAILMVISLTFSLMLFHVASDEFDRALGPRRQGEVRLFIDNEMAAQLRQQRIDDSSARLIGNLVVFNIFVLVGGGGLSYVLARRTLRPIQSAMESQARFSSDAAHELRTPLAVMQAETEVALRDKTATKDAFKTTLISNLDEVNRLRTLTDRLLLLANNHDLVLTHVQVEDVAVDAMNRSLALAQTKNITIENEIGQAYVMAHADSLTDILVILVDNAIKYSPSGSKIRLVSKVHDKSVTLSVIDEGVGMTVQDMEHIFDRFYRVDQSRSKQNVEGHGLGLSIAKRLAELQGASLGVKRNKLVGTTFSIRLHIS